MVQPPSAVVDADASFTWSEVVDPGEIDDRTPAAARGRRAQDSDEPVPSIASRASMTSSSVS